MGERYRHLVRRRGKQRALVAIERSILVVVWHLLVDPNARFIDLCSDFYERRVNKDRRTSDLVCQLIALGHQVTLNPAVWASPLRPERGSAPHPSTRAHVRGVRFSHFRFRSEVAAGAGRRQVDPGRAAVICSAYQYHTVFDGGLRPVFAPPPPARRSPAGARPCARRGTSPAASAAVAIETDRGLWVAALVGTRYLVYALNPKAVARYKERYILSGAKKVQAPFGAAFDGAGKKALP